MKLKYVAIFLVLLCCLMGAASAAEDVSTDVVNDAIDNVIISDEDVDADLQSGESSSLETADTDSGVDQSDASDAIQREVTDDDSFEDAFTRMTKTGYGSEPQVVNILVSPGIYSETIKPNLVWEVDEDYGFGYYRLDGAAKLFALGIFTVEGTGDNVIFRCADGYNLDLKGGIDTTEWRY